LMKGLPECGSCICAAVPLLFGTELSIFTRLYLQMMSTMIYRWPDGTNIVNKELSLLW